ncbi:uncharacterized protein DNG_07548 [Cephalotrichum gorgonifer]|uniref:Mediator of RNA polymerase II transcription subunit 13 n=1 Tax=Cephalotrichum gorgonifer TaxID=2041049 RepID=A0AAE8N3Q8_9PEZI|nr:uncharacterized protein DNG_07548 [Cephalotrichum gorgonifer]
MEAGEYTTNTLVIHNIYSIAYRTYELSATSDYQSRPNPTVIQDVEALLRGRGCIAHFDTARSIIWHFKVTGKDDPISSSSAGPTLPDDLDIPGVTLSLVDDGSFEPMSLSRPRVPGPQGGSAPTSGTLGSASDANQGQKSATSFSPASSSSPPVWGASMDLKPAPSGALTINDAYENFVMALLGTLLSDLVRRTGAIPLDSRTVLISPAGQHLDDLQDGLASKPPAVATFRVYLSPIGSLIVSLGLYPATGFLSLAISWPAFLCFRKQLASLPPVSRVGGNMLLGYTESYDPLASAKAWALETPERNGMLAERKRERDAATTRDPLSDPEVRSQQQVSGNSPLALQRAANVPPAAAGVMYPTPPDGVQNPNAPTPSLGGPAASPQPPPPAVSVVDTDVVMSNAAPVAEAYTERERNEVPYLGDSDNLFDDLGGDMFNDAELTDADFNFFDEPTETTELQVDDVLPDMHVPGPRAPILGGSQRFELLPAPPPAPSTNGVEIEAPASSPAKEPIIKRESPVFAKPELRHARSSLGDDAASASKPGAGANGGKLKREHSPFDPDTVFKRVRTTLYHPPRPGRPLPLRRKSAYDTVEFDHILNPVTSKYANGGKYAVTWEPKKDLSNAKKAPPTTDYLKHHGKHNKGLNGLPENQSALIARITSVLESSSIHASPMKLDHFSADGDDASTVSDQDDSSVSSEEAFSTVKSIGLKRTNYEDDLVSQATSLRDVELSEESDPNFALELPRLGKIGPADVPVHKLFADPEPLALQLSLPDEDMIAVAQVLTEQAATGTLEITHDGSPGGPPVPGPDRRRQLASMARQTLRTLRDSISGYLGGAVECQLTALAEIQDGTPQPAPPTRNHLQPRPVPGRDPTEPATSVYQILPCHLEVKRGESSLTVLPSAIPFWESLGLGPCLGPKNIQAACVFQGWEGMADNVGLFLDRVKTMYESMKMGAFERLPSTSEISDGLVDYDVDRISVTPGYVFPRISSALAERTETLCQALRVSADTEKNFVIFFIYSPTNPSSIVEACTSFRQLSEAYSSSISKNAPSNELVLQLVPLDFVAAPSSIVIQPPAELLKLCLETYDRCTMFGGPMPAPSIMLEQVGPRFMEFGLSPTPSASIMHENSFIHVAYAPSVDGRWITAAWTDSRGRQQMTASYCLGRKGARPSTPFNDVAHEIWETTHDLISIWRVHWRVVITKCGAMGADEADFWTGLAQTESKAKVSLVLLAVDTSPSLQLVPPAVRLSASVSAAIYSTPASTPQASSILSPEQSGGNPPATPAPPGTPGDAGGGVPDSAADKILIDTMDQSWGCVLAHRLSTSSVPAGPPSPSLFSGYLVKRGGTRPEDPPVVMEVNMLQADGGPRQQEGLLREMLGHFRALGTLGRVRGVTGEADVRPWHVAAAEKGVRALYLLM